MWEQFLLLLRETHNWLLIGAAILLGFISGKIVSKLHLPSIIGYLLVGVAVGVSGINAIDISTGKELGLITDLGLSMVAFMIGSELSRRVLRRMGKDLVWVLFTQFFGAIGAIVLWNG